MCVYNIMMYLILAIMCTSVSKHFKIFVLIILLLFLVDIELCSKLSTNLYITVYYFTHNLYYGLQYNAKLIHE